MDYRKIELKAGKTKQTLQFPSSLGLERILGMIAISNLTYLLRTLKASQNEERYNQDDPCLATQQVFLGWSRWIQIYTQNCKKTGSAQFVFHRQQVKKLNNIRNKMFVEMQCNHYIKKYDL